MAGKVSGVILLTWVVTCNSCRRRVSSGSTSVPLGTDIEAAKTRLLASLSRSARCGRGHTSLSASVS